MIIIKINGTIINSEKEREEMKKKIEIIVVFLVTLSFIILGFIKGINLDQNQIETLKILLIIQN